MEVISLYEMEVSPLEILSLMKENIYNHYDIENITNIDKSYIIQRKSLITLIHKISREMAFKSQTFFLAVNYLDIIFSKNNEIPYNYNLLAVGCLIIASKYCENVPLRPIFNNFVNIYNTKIKDNNYINKEKLFEYEIIICKMLNYKLNYFTIYDFNFFFFGNGVIKIEQLKEINPNIASMTIENNNTSSSSKIKKILIKIYERSRHYLDIIIENLICLKYNSLLISICIMEKSIDYVLINEFNLKNYENSFDIDEIKFKNQEYFIEIMKDYYKIDYDLLPKYNELKNECENYKLFGDIYDKISLSNSNNIIPLNHKITNESKSPTKEVNIIKNNSSKQSPDTKYNNNIGKDKIHFLYRKVNIPTQNNIIKNNIKYRRRQHSSNKKIKTSRDNNFQNNLNKIENGNNINYVNSKILTTIDNFYQKNKNTFRNSTSNYKNNNYYLKKCNTSSSPFKKSPTNNLKNCNKSKILSKIKNKSIIEGSVEGLTTNSNSIDTKRNKKKINNNNLVNLNKNLVKPYIKKIVQNYDKAQEDNNRCKDNKNININININNKILYEGPNDYKDRTKPTKKILISKYLNSCNYSIIRGKSLAHKSKTKYKKNNNEEKENSSPIIERNNSNFKYKYNYVPFKFNKNNLPVNDNSIIANKSNSIYIKEIDKNNNNNDNKNTNKNANVYKMGTKYNVYSTNLTSRNSFQYPMHNPKLTDSLINIKMTRLNNEQNDKNLSILDYNHIDNKNKINEHINNYSELNIFKYKNNLNKNNNIFDSNYIESYKSKKEKINKFQNGVNNININIKEFNENEKNDHENNNEKNNDKQLNKNNFSNTNLLDFSTIVSNEKNVY